jgi:hypothetical protein
MYKPEYPEWGRREAMLWAIYEWVQDRPAGEDLIRESKVATLVGGGEYANPTDLDADKEAVKYQTEQINLFITLVNEGLIDADIHKPIEDLPFTSATVRGLSGKGLQMIQELSDPDQALLDRLDDMTLAIKGLQDVPEEEKEELIEELKDFARRLAPQLTLKLLPLLDKLLALLDKSPGG